MLKLSEVGLTVILGVVVAVPDTVTVLLSAALLDMVMVPFWVPDEVGL